MAETRCGLRFHVYQWLEFFCSSCVMSSWNKTTSKYFVTKGELMQQSVPDQSVPHKGSRKKGSRSNFGTFLVCPEQFSKRPEGDALNVHKSRMYTNQDIHMRVWDHMKCIPTGLPNLKECPPGHIIHPGIVSSGHSVSGHSVTRGIVSLRGNVSPGAYCPSRRT